MKSLYDNAVAEIVSLLYDLVDDINIAQELALIRIASRILSIFKTIYNANHYSRNLIGSTMPCVTNSLSIGNTENDLSDIMNYSSLPYLTLPYRMRDFKEVCHFRCLLSKRSLIMCVSFLFCQLCFELVVLFYRLRHRMVRYTCTYTFLHFNNGMFATSIVFVVSIIVRIEMA